MTETMADTPGAFSSKEELRRFIKEMSQQPDADQDPLKTEIERARQRLEDLPEDQ